MNDDIYAMMQRAVDIVGTSPHPTNKIAATLCGQDHNGHAFTISYNNYWPQPIAERLGMDIRIGNSSGTIHAETACILHAPATKNAVLLITDPPCPNCVKNIAEAGIRTLYVDHKGFEKDFAQRRGHEFDRMSIKICQRAGIAVYKMFRKEKKIEPLLVIPPGYAPPVEKPSFVENLDLDLSPALVNFWIKMSRKRYGDEPFALAFASNPQGERFVIAAEPHPVIGFTRDTMDEPDDKYSFILQPVNRVLMTAARKGVHIQNGTLYSSMVPTARELVNLIGAGITQITIGDSHAARDQYGPMAMMQLREAGILNIE